MLSVSPWTLANDFAGTVDFVESETVFVDNTLAKTAPQAVGALMPLAAAPDGFNANDWEKLYEAGLVDEDGDTLKGTILWNTDVEKRLVKLEVLGCELTDKLDLSDCAALEVLSCSVNELTALDITGCTALDKLDCYSNKLTALDVSDCTALTELFCHGNQLGTLDVSSCTALKQLSCGENNLDVLDVSSCTTLSYLDCYDNNLTTLDVSYCPTLDYLNCHTNQLESLNVNGCVALIHLNCDGNKLTTLDIASCTAMEFLYCDSNKLTALDVSGFDALRYLQCAYNNLTLASLDIDGCTGLWDVNIKGNKFTFSTIAELYALIELNTGSPALCFYDAQQDMVVQTTLKTSGELDLSSENIGGKTTYAWYYTGGETPAPVTEVSPGVFTFTDLEEGDSVYCMMTNEDFEFLELRTTAILISDTVVVTPPDTPTGFAVDGEPTHGSVTLKWNTVTDAASYEIIYKKTDETTWSEPSRYSSSPATVSELATETKYEFKIRAVKDGGDTSDWSTPVSATTDKEGTVSTPPATPTGFAVDGTPTHNSVTLKWTAVTDATSYEIRYKKTEETTWSTPSTHSSPATITGLTAETAYDFQIRAVNAGGESDWSASVSATTDKEGTVVTPPAAPENFAVDGTPTHNSVTLKWDSVANTTYTLTYGEQGTPETGWKTLTFTAIASTAKATVCALSAGKVYDFKLTTKVNGVTSLAATATATTDTAAGKEPAAEPTKVAKPKADKAKAGVSSVTLTWQPATADTFYELVIVKKKKEDVTKSVSCSWKLDADGKIIGVVFSNLDPNSGYKFTIVAKNADDKAAQKKEKDVTFTVSAKTAKYPAVKIDKPSKKKGTLTANSVTLNWGDPKAPVDRPTTLYEVYLVANKGKSPSDFTLLKTVPVDASPLGVTIATIDGKALEAGTKYTFAVRAVVKDVVSGETLTKSLDAKVSVKTLK